MTALRHHISIQASVGAIPTRNAPPLSALERAKFAAKDLSLADSVRLIEFIYEREVFNETAGMHYGALIHAIEAMLRDAVAAEALTDETHDDPRDARRVMVCGGDGRDWSGYGA